MFRVFYTVLRNIKLVHNPPPLGRWRIQCDKSNNIKNFLANHDSCGDDLCGNPLLVKKMIEKEIKFQEYK